jgi:hypothetical protein
MAIVLLVAFVFCGCAHRHRFKPFAWIDVKEDNTLMRQIVRDFSEELEPDDPGKVARTMPYLAKYIFRVGIFNSSALVLIRHRENSESEDYFVKAYHYDIPSRYRKKIETLAKLWLWKLSKHSSIESPLTPDIFFEYQTCTECCAAFLISSFKYNPGKREWEIREWKHGDAIFIGYLGAEFVSDCLFKIEDFDCDGFDAVAVRCKNRAMVPEDVDKAQTSIQDTTTLYSIKKGVPKEQKIIAPQELARIHSILCKGQQNHPLCNEDLNQ